MLSLYIFLFFLVGHVVADGCSKIIEKLYKSQHLTEKLTQTALIRMSAVNIVL